MDGLLHRIRWDNVARLVAVLAVVAFAVVWLRSGEDRPSVPSSVPRPVTGAAPALPPARTIPEATAPTAAPDPGGLAARTPRPPIRATPARRRRRAAARPRTRRPARHAPAPPAAATPAPAPAPAPTPQATDDAPSSPAPDPPAAPAGPSQEFLP